MQSVLGDRSDDDGVVTVSEIVVRSADSVGAPPALPQPLRVCLAAREGARDGTHPGGVASRPGGLAGVGGGGISATVRLQAERAHALSLHHPDALWVQGEDGVMTAVSLPRPEQVDVQRICQSIARRVARRDKACADERHAVDAGADSALDAALAEASQPLLPGSSSAHERMPRDRTAFVDGFSVDANPVAEEHDRAGLERLIRYGTRPAFAQGRLSLTASGKVSYKLKRPWFTGQTHVVLAPVAFLRRLVALIPRPRQNTIRYHGCFAPHARARPGIIALVPRRAGDAQALVSPGTCIAENPHDPKSANSARTTRHSWAQLYRRVFAEDLLVCTRCGGPRRLIAFLSETNPVPLRSILRHIGLPTEPPRTAPARASPQSDFWVDSP